eukprot:UN05401
MLIHINQMQSQLSSLWYKVLGHVIQQNLQRLNVVVQFRRTFFCEFAHKLYKRPLNCPDGENCKNLQKYLYHKKLTNELTTRPAPGAQRVRK